MPLWCKFSAVHDAQFFGSRAGVYPFSLSVGPLFFWKSPPIRHTGILTNTGDAVADEDFTEVAVRRR